MFLKRVYFLFRDINRRSVYFNSVWSRFEQVPKKVRGKNSKIKMYIKFSFKCHHKYLLEKDHYLYKIAGMIRTLPRNMAEH